ncbi:MAG: prepilin-type N-terminal cleavage/methylation domain-containing protein [Desulfobacter sp.]|nr:MAG: prepilin-type N-terminal cleavage/methylation domain-containing protein [Desulfobacter sp.]
MKSNTKKEFHNFQGFTLIEILVTIAIASIVLLIVVQFFISTNKLNTIQEKVAATQQSLRAAMEIMSRDIRLAGLDPSGTAPDEGFVDNGTETMDTDGDSIAIRYDYDGDGGCETNVSYYYNSAKGTFNFWPGGASPPQSLTEDGTVSSVTFSYTLADGTIDPDPTASGRLADIRVVSISICGTITGAYDDGRTYCFSNTIRPRNM